MNEPFAMSVVPNEAIRRGAPWLSGAGAAAEVVISSRVRLARNLAGAPFPGRCNAEQRLAVLGACRKEIVSAGLAASGARLTWADVHGLPTLERQVLLERHLISKEHAGLKQADGSAAAGAGASGAQQVKPPGVGPARGVAFTLPDESLSIMVNEEDHLRLQVLRPGLALTEAWKQADAADDALEATLGYAYSPRLGYLTACPTNVGCAVRMSVMLHLPALRLTGDVEKVRRATRDMALAVRGFYGENSEAAGDLFQISNQTTLGKSEAVLLRDLEREILPEVIAYELTSRKLLLEKRRRFVDDQVCRALGLLRSARLLTPEEALSQLSLVRLGVLTGLIGGVEEQAVTQLFLLTQPAHLQRAIGRELNQQGRREARADLCRAALAGAAPTGG